MQLGSAEINNVVPIHPAKTGIARPHYSVVCLKGLTFEESMLVQGISEILSIFGLNHPWIREWLNSDKATLVYPEEHTFFDLNKYRQFFMRRGVPVSMRNNSCLVLGPMPTSWVEKMFKEASA